MSRFYTPEEMVAKRKRNKVILYTTILVGTVLLSAFLTLLSNQM